MNPAGTLRLFTGSSFANLAERQQGIPPEVFGFIAALIVLAIVFRTIGAAVLPLLSAAAALGSGLGLAAFDVAPDLSFLLAGFSALGALAVPFLPPVPDEPAAATPEPFRPPFLSLGSSWAQGFLEAGMLALLPLYGFFTFGFHGGYAVYFPELFPTRLRSTGAGMCFNGGRLLAAPVLFWIVPWLKGIPHLDLRIAVMLVSLFYLLGLVILIFLPETKGRPLPEN